MKADPVRLFGLFGLTAFPAVGILFLAAPQGVLSFFNAASFPLGLEAMPVSFPGFYLVLTAAYMYLVSFLSYRIIREPGNPAHLFFLAHAKIASAVISVVLILRDHPYLLYVVNFMVDGVIGWVAWRFYRRVKV